MNPEQQIASKTQSNGSRLELWAFRMLVALVFLTPLVFIASSYIQQSAIKGYFVIFVILVSAILYCISRIKARSYEWIKHPLSYVGVAFGVLVIVSSITSGNFIGSFFGQGFEYGTGVFLIFLCILARLSAILSSRDTTKTLSLYFATLSSFGVLALYQIVKIVKPGFLSFGVFTASTSTPAGSWYDLGIFAGVVFIITSLAFSYLPMNRKARYAAGVFFAVSALFLILIGLPTLWFAIALVFLALSVHAYVNEGKGVTISKRLPIFYGALFLVALLFSWKGNLVTAPLVDHLGADYSEVHLPWQMTLDVGTGAIKAAPILGSGPNTFDKDYLLYKPLAVNQTDFWSIGFSDGSGLIPTIALSLGLLGIIMLCLFFVYFIRAGVRTLNVGRVGSNQTKPDVKSIATYVSYSAFFTAAFLLYMDFVYVPSYAAFVLTFVMIGVFLGSKISNGQVKLVNIPFNYKQKPPVYARSVGIAVIVLLAIAFVWYVMSAVALGYFTAGAAAISNTARLADANADFRKAVALDPLDIYDEALAETDITAVNAIMSQITAGGANAKPTAAQIQQVGTLLNDAASYSAQAIKRDPTNHFNYLSAARVFAVAASLQVTGAYDAAITAYTNTAKYDPYDPSIYLGLAQLAANQGKYADATGYIGSAIQLKNNYTDAVYLLSQVQVAQDKTADAITSVKFAIQLNPNDPTAYYELGLLQYSSAAYTDAIQSFQKALSVSKQYANAQYFLGLSYAKTGDLPDAVAQFQALSQTNPNNSDVASILANLEAGKSPFANQAPPVSTPEKRSSPPISDQSSANTGTATH